MEQSNLDQEACNALANESNVKWRIDGDKTFMRDIVWFCINERKLP